MLFGCDESALLDGFWSLVQGIGRAYGYVNDDADEASESSEEDVGPGVDEMGCC